MKIHIWSWYRSLSHPIFSSNKLHYLLKHRTLSDFIRFSHPCFASKIFIPYYALFYETIHTIPVLFVFLIQVLHPRGSSSSSWSRTVFASLRSVPRFAALSSSGSHALSRCRSDRHVFSFFVCDFRSSQHLVESLRFFFCFFSFIFWPHLESGPERKRPDLCLSFSGS